MGDIMVTFLSKKPSASKQFAQAFSNLGQTVGETIPQFLMGRQQTRAQQEQEAKRTKNASDFLGIDVSGYDPETIRGLMVEKLKQQGKENLFEKKQDFLGQILGKQQQHIDRQNVGGQQIPGMEGQFEESSLQKDGFDVSRFSHKDILGATAIDKDIGGMLEKLNKTAVEQERFNKQEVGESYKENKDFINKTYDQYEDTLRRDAILSRMDQLEDNGQLSESGIINALEALGLSPEWIKNPSNSEYTKLSLDLLGGGSLQSDYGSRVLQSEFAVAQQRIPTLSQTSEGRKQIKENLKAMLLPSMLKRERMQFYLDQSERTGKPLPHDLRGKILRDIKPQLEEAYDKFKQRNGRYKVKEGIEPDDNAIEKYYYISGGNEDKALQMMKEDNYDISQFS